MKCKKTEGNEKRKVTPARNIVYGILTIYTNGLTSGFPEIGALVPNNFYNLIVRIRHPALHGAIYLHQKTGFARHPVKGRCHWKQ